MSASRPDRLRLAALVTGAVGLAACVVALFIDAGPVVAGWLTAAVFVLGLPLGALTVLMIHTLTGGKWGDALVAPLRAVLMTLPVALLMLVPLLGGLDVVFAWAAEPASALAEPVRQKLAYLNQPFFIVRFVICSAVWIALAWCVAGWTDERQAGRWRDRARWSAGGLIVQALTVSVFSVDWMMSLDPEFYSTIYPLIELAGEVVGALALALVALAAKRAIEETPGGAEHVALSEDISNVLYGFVLIWVYLTYMQWLIVWAADLPLEIHWYLERVEGGWQWVAWLVAALGFAVPFGTFMSRRLKRTHIGMMVLGGVILASHLLDVFWRVRPAMAPPDFAVGWADLAGFAAVGGLWLAAFLFVLAAPDRVDGWITGHRHA